MNIYIGLDIGGTKIAAGVFNEQKELLSFNKIPTYNVSSPSEFVNLLSCDLQKLLGFLGEYKLCGIGIGVPGLVSKGVVIKTPNIACLTSFPLADALRERFSCNVVLGNDANVAALCQFNGLKQVENNMVYITVSSGIGGGIILNGKIFEGDFGSAAELGHMLTGRGGFLCACGNEGCFESMASGANLTKKVLKYAKEGVLSPLTKKALNGEKITGFDVKIAYDNGDALAEKIINETAKLVGELAYNIFMVLNIESYCIGGGLTAWGEPLFKGIEQSFNSLNNFGTGKATFYKATDSDDAGVIGAVGLLWS